MKTTTNKTKKHPLIGKHVIVRDNLAGVFFGILTEKNGTELTLTKARKFFRFHGANTVEDLATQGALNINDSKLTIAVDVTLSNYCQIIPCTKEAIEKNNSIPVWKANK